MKRLFGHTKKPYEEFEEDRSDWDADWDAREEEEYDAQEELEDEEGTYYADEEYYEDENYYGDEEAEESEYYAEDDTEDDIEASGYYAEEESGEAEYYAQDDEAEDAAYYIEEEYPEEAEYYPEDDTEPYEAEEYYPEDDAEAGYYIEEEERSAYHSTAAPKRQRRTGKKAGPGVLLAGLWNRFLEMGTMDKIITSTGVAVLVLALVTGSIYASARIADGQVDEFVTVGAQLDGITTIGETGLMAVADAELARLAAAGVVEQEQNTEYDETEYSRQVTVKLELTSVQKDLKVKFTNEETGKLIANVPFSVTVTDPEGDSETWTDDDMDGIIYQKDITPGTYKVSINALTDAKYADYTIPQGAQSVVVKKDITYQKIDVKNEIKKESEVDAAKEDTRKNETVVESSLQDTVEWVESTSTVNTYTEVAKSTIPDPATYAMSGSFLRMATYTASVSPSSKTLKVGESFTVTAQCPEVNLTNVTWTSSNPGAVKVEGSGASATVTALGATNGAVLISFSASGSTVSGNNAVTGLTGTCSVTVSDAAGSVSLDQSSMTLAIGAQGTAKAQAAGFTAGKQLTYSVSSNRTDIATASVDASGNLTIKGVAAGDAVITLTVNYTGGAAATAASAALNVKVTGNKTITLDKTSATVYLTAPVTINASITNATTQNAVTAESSDTGVATVSVSGRAVTITGVSAGSAVITVKYSENGEEVKAACAVTVKAHPREDKTSKLKDSSGQQLYVLENNAYREAVYADYYTADKFFVKGEAKYTGWQTLDGKVYFFDASGNKVTGEQVIQGAKYNFASDGSLVTGSGTMGIDVSKWNGTIDWEAVKNSGVSYVIIRCGYRGSSQGSLIEDPKYAANIKGATAAGLKVGVYFFTQAVDAVEAVEEASMVLELVKNYKISYPIFLDVESSGGRADGIDKQTRTEVCKAFCQTIQNAGYTAGIYANKTWLTSKIDTSALSAYKIWLAQYAAKPTYEGRYDLWQYKSTGRVSGISGNVDLNLSYLGY